MDNLEDMNNNELNIAIDRAAKLLIEKEMTLAFAESATAGMASAEFSLACDAGKFLKGGFICYDAELKSSVLKVPEELLEQYTPESMQVTQAIALGLIELVPADIHIGITGLPCPGGSETEEKPVGTMFIAALMNGEPWFKERVIFSGSHQEILARTVQHVALLLVRKL
jgi:nicotinamide-nucleotide amidase